MKFLTVFTGLALGLAACKGAPKEAPTETEKATVEKTKPAGKKEPKGVHVVMKTEFGDVTMYIDTEKAPRTATNFLRYVDDGFFKGSRVHRTVTMDNQPNNDVKIEVIQASVDPSREKDEYPPIKIERTTETGLKHTDGCVSMARAEPDTATSSFFICIGDQPSLDFAGKRNPDGQGFAAFGHVTQGMDVVKKIQMSPEEDQALTPPIKIQDIVRLRAPRSNETPK